MLQPILLNDLLPKRDGKGEAWPLRVGMKGEARTIVGSRTLIEYAFEPIRQLRENVRR